MNNKIFVVSNDNFKSLIKENKLVLVDFWADWCGPCKMLAPIIDDIATEMDDVVVAKCNVDECENLAMEYDIMSIPAIFIFKNGKIVDKAVGFRQKAQLMALLNKNK